MICYLVYLIVFDISGDNITGSVTSYTYDTNNKTGSVTGISKTAGLNSFNYIKPLTESYTYNGYNQPISKAFTGAATQNYAFNYKDNAARDLDFVTLPNTLKCYPKTDFYRRNTGKILTDAEGNKKYGEQVCYVKQGDRATNRVSSVRYGSVKNSVYGLRSGINYCYDKAGNISEIYEDGELYSRYTYDTLNRLIREDNKALDTTEFISYDNCGNILSRKQTAFTIKSENEIETAFEKTFYAYDGDRLITYDGQNISYDAMGNPINYRGYVLTWEFGKRLKTFGGVNFTYDGYGRRIKKNDAVYTYDNDNRLIKQASVLNGGAESNAMKFVYDTSGLSGFKQNGTIYMVGGNGLYTMYIYETLKNQWTNIGQLKGEKGEKGENGVNGTNGADGVTPNITLSAISTSFTTPSVNRTGTFPNFNYQLSIPKGAKGDSGTNGTTPNITMTAVSTTSSTPSVTKGGTTANPTFQLSIPKGTDGVTPNITLKAENAAGTTPSVTKGGTTANPIFTLAIPKGEKGEKGVKGDKGDPGGSESKAVFVGNVDFVVDNNPNNNVEIDLFSELDNVSGSEITSTLLISIAGEMGTLTFMHDLDYSQTITYGDLGSQIFLEFIEPSRTIVKVWSFSSQHITQIIVKCL